MKHKETIGRHRHLFQISLAILFVASIALFGDLPLSDEPVKETTTAHAQTQGILLEQRLNQVEQRFNYVESRLNRLESESRYPGTLPNTSSQNGPELTLMRAQMDSLRTEIDGLRDRTTELECAVLKLDERTLSAAAKSGRRLSGANEVCRTNPGAPVKLSARP